MKIHNIQLKIGVLVVALESLWGSLFRNMVWFTWIISYLNSSNHRLISQSPHILTQRVIAEMSKESSAMSSILENRKVVAAVMMSASGKY